jgi:hypothetical protein
MQPDLLDILPVSYLAGGTPSELCKDMLTEAFLDKKLLEKAWYEHPNTFHFRWFVTAVGRA